MLECGDLLQAAGYCAGALPIWLLHRSWSLRSCSHLASRRVLAGDLPALTARLLRGGDLLTSSLGGGRRAVHASVTLPNCKSEPKALGLKVPASLAFLCAPTSGVYACVRRGVAAWERVKGGGAACRTVGTVVDAVVVGGGFAGLAVSGALKAAGLSHVVFERSRPCQTWLTQRWDSFRMNTPNLLTVMPGEAYRAPSPEGAMTRDEFSRRCCPMPTVRRCRWRAEPP